ncbi:MAG: FHA domain-containing protein [Myxococcota bacterium]
MATFTIKGKPGVTLEGEDIVLGTSSSASYALADPFCAGKHCRIGGGGGSFWIEDLGTSVGTFVNGAAVEDRRPLADGDEIVIGATRLTVGIDAAKDEISLKAGKAFYYDSKVDNLQLAKKEVAFGRFRSVRIGNWTAIFLGLLFIPLLFLPGTHEKIMEPADTWHHGGPYREAYLAQLADLPEDQRGCNACHTSFGILPNTKGSDCMACHADDIDRGHHPFGYASADDWDVACATCHVDHRGTGEGDLITIPAEASCGSCHAADLPLSGGRKRPETMAEVMLRYDTFSHADHYEKAAQDGKSLDCSSCHVLRKDGDEAKVDVEGGRRREFLYVDYEGCMECHQEGAPPSRQAAVTFAASWHGVWEDEANQQKCLACHGELWSADLKKVPHTPRDYEFVIDSQPHDPASFPGFTGKGACVECHRNGAELEAKAKRRGIFEHATHVWDARPTTKEAMQRISGHGVARGEGPSGDCMQCHQEVAASNTLGNAATESFTTAACAECHKPNDTVAEARALAEVLRVDFPHDLKAHLDLEAGCFACHPSSVTEGVIAPNPTTAEAIRNCAECHGASAPEGSDPRLHPAAMTAHRNVGGTGAMDSGSCHECHRAGDPSFFGPESELGRWTRHTDIEFSHLSRGHRAMTEEGKCVDCHGAETWQATRIRDVPILAEDAPACRKCHVEEKRQFHWR